MPDTVRQPEHPVHPQFPNRWSPRAFRAEPIGEAALLTILEAGRWAPSAFNIQPWHFIYARAGTPAWDAVFATLLPFNQTWAQRAAALVIVVSAEQWTPPGTTEAKPNGTHAFDAGAAAGYIALQASLSGWHAHTMSGIDAAVARERLGIPAGHAVHAAIAIGRLSEDISFLSASQQAREGPSPRRPLAEIASEGRFA